MMRAEWKSFGVCAALLTACAGTEATGQSCRIVQRTAPLPSGVEEASGVAASRSWPGVLWTHNDSGGDPVVIGVRAGGARVASVEVTGAKNRDWEDIAVGPCSSGSCLYIADTGDNDEKRDDAALYRAPEPREGASSVAAERFPVRYPHGPRDAEALFVLPTGQPFLVTKGRHSAVELYRYPLPLRAGETVTLERVAVIDADGREGMDLVTSASASPSGRWVAVRTYKSLSLYHTDALLRGDTRPAQVVDLTLVGEPQGEGVALFDDGRVLLTSEGGFKDNPASISILQCPLE
jgi:hypothetical protein